MKDETVRRFSIKRVEAGQAARILDDVAAEEPLGVHIRYWFKDTQLTESLAVTMRTPGHDRELVAGFLLSEGIIRSGSDLADLRALGADPSNEIVAELSRYVDFEAWRVARTSVMNSSCGLCGKHSLEAVRIQLPRALDGNIMRIDTATISELPERLRNRQTGFAKTGGLHAAALVNSTGEIDAVFEDIGRHNALDKVIGDAVLRAELPVRGYFFLSSRGSFELVQKAAMAGAPILATVGGPSSLAIEAARDYGLTLIGFVRDRHFNVYSGEWRVNS